MNNRILTFPLLALAAVSAFAVSPKRGVSEDSFSLGCQIEALSPGVSWYYNWRTAAPVGYQNEIDQLDMEFVPMCWNGAYDADAIREYCKKHPKTKYLLGFNEPNFTNQANMTPEAAAAKWPEVQALAKELGLEIVAPALNYSPNPPYTDPCAWMDEFVKLVGPDAFDYTAIHNYGGLGVMKDLSGKFWTKYQKPVWVTEFCFWPGGAGKVTVAPSTQIGSMVESVEWLEKTDYIFRYAWFKPIGQYNAAKDSPNYGLFQTQQSFDETLLSEQGNVYVYMSEFDSDVWHPAGETIAATEYIARNIATLGNGANPDCPVPIEVSSFATGAWLDYQFDVPTAGDYYLVLRVSGVGEPVRFDPTLAVYEVDAEGNSGSCLMEGTKFNLTGSDDIYTDLWLPLTLTAGHNRLRLADGNAYAPSGMRISTVSLIAKGAGTGTVANDDATATDVYGIDGVRVRSNVSGPEATEGLPAGIYIVGGKKVLVK